MNSSFQTKKIKNLRDLEREKMRLKHSYQKMESDTIHSVTFTDEVLFSVVKSILGGIIKNKIPNKEINSIFNFFFKKAEKRDFSKTASKKGTAASPTENTEQQKTRKSYRKLGRSFIWWEAFSAIAFVAFNILLQQKRRKKSK